MKQKFRLFAIHQTPTSLQRTNYLNPKTIWYPVLDESNMMKSVYFTIHPSKKYSSLKWLPVEIQFLVKCTGFTSSTFPIQPDFSQNQPAAIALNPGNIRLGRILGTIGQKSSCFQVQLFTCCDQLVFLLLIWGIFHRFLWNDQYISRSLDELQPVVSQTQPVHL